MNLRDYQSDCLDAVVKAYKSGKRRQIIAIPTGGGKTVTFSALAKKMQAGRALVLAHRQELIDQAAATLRSVIPSVQLGIERAELRSLPDDQIVVGSVQSVAQRLEKFDPSEFLLLVIDEAHHSAAATYRKIIEHFGLHDGGSNRRGLLLGVTATPQRGTPAETARLRKVFDDVTYSISISDLIERGYLVPIHGYRIDTAASLESVKKQGGDYAVGQLAEAIDTPERNGLIVATYQKYVAGESAFAFCATVQHAVNLAAQFNAVGVTAACVHGGMESAARAAEVEKFKSGGTKVLCNVGIFTEGTDIPQASAVLMARPTRSPVLYSQCVGRGVRLHDGKERCAVLDFCDAGAGKDLAMSAARMFGLGNVDLEGGSVTEAAKRVDEIGIDPSELDTPEPLTLEEVQKLAAARAQVSSLAGLPSELEGVTNLAWIKRTDGSFYLSAFDAGVYTVTVDQLGKATAVGPGGPIVTDAELPAAIAAAEAQVRNAPTGSERGDVAAVLDRDAPWRAKEPSEKQLEIAAKLKIDAQDGITRGELSDLINQRKAEPATDKQVRLLRDRGAEIPANLTKYQAKGMIAKIMAAAR